MKRLGGNIFTQNSGSDRMKELLCVGKYCPDDDYPPLKIPFNDLFRFWWNRCVDREMVVDDAGEWNERLVTNDKRLRVKDCLPGMDHVKMTFRLLYSIDQLPFIWRQCREILAFYVGVSTNLVEFEELP
jgi:hypothetical protein